MRRRMTAKRGCWALRLAVDSPGAIHGFLPVGAQVPYSDGAKGDAGAVVLYVERVIELIFRRDESPGVSLGGFLDHSKYDPGATVER